jgi:hypothetical protein
MSKSTTYIACGDDNERETSFRLAEVLPKRSDLVGKSVIGDRARTGSPIFEPRCDAFGCAVSLGASSLLNSYRDSCGRPIPITTATIRLARFMRPIGRPRLCRMCAGRGPAQSFRHESPCAGWLAGIYHGAKGAFPQGAMLCRPESSRIFPWSSQPGLLGRYFAKSA